MAIGLKIVNGDFLIEGRKLSFIQDNEKLLRDFRKFLLTEAEQENNLTSYYRYNPKYGTNTNNKELYINLSTQSIIDLINQNLSISIKYYVALQESRNNLSLGEIISNVEYMTYADTVDKRIIRINMNIIVPKNNVLNVGTFSQTTV
jgi:hypothetical protein